MWNKNEMSIPRDGDSDWRCVCFNWINCNVGGAIDDGKFRMDRYMESLVLDCRSI